MSYAWWIIDSCVSQSYQLFLSFCCWSAGINITNISLLLSQLRLYCHIDSLCTEQNLITVNYCINIIVKYMQVDLCDTTRSLVSVVTLWKGLHSLMLCEQWYRSSQFFHHLISTFSSFLALVKFRQDHPAHFWAFSTRFVTLDWGVINNVHDVLLMSPVGELW